MKTLAPRRPLAAWLFTLALSTLALAVQAETKPIRAEPGGEPPHSLLWVGNSFFYYNNSMHGHYNSLAHSLEPKEKFRGTSVTVSGSGIDWHDLETYLRPGLIGKYTFAPGNKIVFNPPGKQYDAVIVMDCSQCPIHPQLKDTFQEYAKKDAGLITAYGARPVFFMSWAYKDKPEMTAQLAEAYTLAGNANDALVIPAGLAFARAIAGREGLELYQKDKRHPTLAGTYLGACTTYAALRGKSPVGASYTAGLDADLAAYLQGVAWETVKKYYGK